MQRTDRLLRQITVPEVYYGRSLTASFLDHLSMEDRFSTNTKVATLGLCLVPTVVVLFARRMIGQSHVNNLAYLYTRVTYLLLCHYKRSCTVGETLSMQREGKTTEP